MPNWTQNWLTIKKDVAAKYLVDGKFDFNKVIPMPEIYTKKNADAPYGPHYSGSNADECVIIYMTGEFARELSELDEEAMHLTLRSIKGGFLDDLLKAVDWAKRHFVRSMGVASSAANIRNRGLATFSCPFANRTPAALRNVPR